MCCLVSGRWQCASGRSLEGSARQNHVRRVRIHPYRGFLTAQVGAGTDRHQGAVVGMQL